MKLTGLLILLTLATDGLFGQDRHAEWKLLAQNEKLQKSRCKEITEKEYYPLFNGVSSAYDSAKVVCKYELDTLGYLSRITEYTSIGTTDVKNYLRNQRGQYYSKEYIFYDSSGNLKYHDKWKFDYNSKGQIIKSELVRGDEILRTVTMEYDTYGNYSSQTSTHPYKYKWTYKYDRSGDLVELKEWTSGSSTDSFRCVSVKTYEYKNRHLIREIKKSCETNEVWDDFEYRYDSKGNLVQINEKRTSWVTSGNGPREREITEFKTVCVNDVAGRILSMSTFMNTEKLAFHYVYYEYKEWKN